MNKKSSLHEKEKEQRHTYKRMKKIRRYIKLYGSANTKSMTDSLVLFPDRQREKKIDVRINMSY